MSREPKDLTAADWVIRHDSELNPAERRAYDAWLKSKPQHGSEVEELTATWNALGRPLQTGQTGQVLRELAIRQHRRHWLRSSAGVAAIAAAIVVAFVLQSRRGPSARTFVAPSTIVMTRPIERVLTDGSIVDLKGDAEISIDFSKTVRRVILRRGEALFHVAKNRQWPFVVQADGVEVRAVGTAFSVNLSDSPIKVLVEEGRVAVDRSRAHVPNVPARTPPVFIDAGNQALIDGTAQGHQPILVTRVSELEIKKRLAWSDTRLEFTGTLLSDAVATLNRLNRVKFTIADASLMRMRISGYIGSGNVEGFVSMLEGNFGIKAERSSGNEIRLVRGR